MSTQAIINTGIYTIVDVRSTTEFQSGSIDGSQNIPLPELATKIDEIKALQPPLILCCAMGVRSGKAQEYLSALGIQCVNGGGWLEVNALLEIPKG